MDPWNRRPCFNDRSILVERRDEESERGVRPQYFVVTANRDQLVDWILMPVLLDPTEDYQTEL